MAHPNYLARILHRPASRARVLLNGIPLYDRTPDKNVAPITPITQWLVQGENTVTIELFPAPVSPLTPFLGPHFQMAIMPADDQDSRVFAWEYPDTLKDAGLPTELPLVFPGLLRIEHALPEASYRRATPEDFPIEGTPEQRAAVFELYDAFGSRDPARFEAAMALKVSEFERFYGPQPLSRVDALSRMNQPWVMDPFDEHDLRFERYEGGRVAYARRFSGRPAVRAVHQDEPYFGWGSDLFMTRLDGRWRIFW